MDNKFYISYEAARLLKEKGYDIKRDFLTPVYNENGCLYWSNHEDLSDKIPAITKAEAIDWLESKGIVVELSYDDQAHKDNARWNFYIYTHDNDGWVEALICSWYENDFYTTRLEAEDAAIIKALELL